MRNQHPKAITTNPLLLQNVCGSTVTVSASLLVVYHKVSVEYMYYQHSWRNLLTQQYPDQLDPFLPYDLYPLYPHAKKGLAKISNEICLANQIQLLKFMQAWVQSNIWQKQALNRAYYALDLCNGHLRIVPCAIFEFFYHQYFQSLLSNTTTSDWAICCCFLAFEPSKHSYGFTKCLAFQH